MINNLSNALLSLAEIPCVHRPSSHTYIFLKTSIRNEIETVFGPKGVQQMSFSKIGILKFPFCKMGKITTLDLFGLDELIILSFYYQNRRRYKRFVDIGANLGLHSIMCSMMGYKVVSFEPDPIHFKKFSTNIMLNNQNKINRQQAAVSTHRGTCKFVRVLGNTTGSHLAGAKESYGRKEMFDVKIQPIDEIFINADLIKIDAEGHEARILLKTKKKDWRNTDVIVEIGSIKNRSIIYKHCSALGINMFPQKIGWSVASSKSDLPTSHREGSLFLSLKSKMPW